MMKKLEFYFNPKKMADIFQIEDEYRRKFTIDHIIQSLRFRSKYTKNSNKTFENLKDQRTYI